MIKNRRPQYLLGIVSIALTFFCLSSANAQLSDSVILAQDKGGEQSLNKRRLGIAIGLTATTYTSGVLYLSEVWYRDDQRVKLHYYNDSKGWNQVDKVAHAYIAYHQSRAGYHFLRWSGLDKTKALWFGGTLGFVFQLPIEIFDGLYEGYGFSWPDVIANTTGTALFMLQQGFWDEQRIKMKFSFYPSAYAEVRPGYLGRSFSENLFQDYNAQTYWLSISLKDFFKQSKLPPWLNVAVGYGAAGMLGEFENPVYISGELAPEFSRYRQFFIAPDINFAKIKTNSRVLKILLDSFNLLKMPAPAVEYNTQNGWVFHLVYF